LEKVLNFLLSIDVFVGFVTGGVVAYYTNSFHSSWREYMRSIGATAAILGNNSPFAIFSPSLPERCRVLRRKLLIAGAVFIGAAVFGLIILYSMTLLGYVPQK
jgi:hypothetical protein